MHFEKLLYSRLVLSWCDVEQAGESQGRAALLVLTLSVAFRTMRHVGVVASPRD